jgi:hypothetical protein
MEYTPVFGLPGARLYSVEGVPDAGLGEDGDQATSVNGTTYKRSGGVWAPQQSGTSVQDSRISVYSAAGVIAGGLVTGFAQDDLAGSDIDLNADGIHVDLKTAGTYFVQAFYAGVAAHFTGVAVNGVSGGQDGYGAQDRVMIRVKTATVQIAIGGSDASAPGSGIDVYRVA